MDAREQTALAAQSNRQDQKDGEARLCEQSRRRLQKIVETKLRTSFIGAIAEVEESIGRQLWGHGLPEDECSAEQLRWRAVWEATRKEILNNGNNQLRAANNELTQYDVKWNRCSVTLPVRGRNDGAE